MAVIRISAHPAKKRGLFRRLAGGYRRTQVPSSSNTAQRLAGPTEVTLENLDSVTRGISEIVHDYTSGFGIGVRVDTPR